MLLPAVQGGAIYHADGFISRSPDREGWPVVLKILVSPHVGTEACDAHACDARACDARACDARACDARACMCHPQSELVDWPWAGMRLSIQLANRTFSCRISHQKGMIIVQRLTTVQNLGITVSVQLPFGFYYSITMLHLAMKVSCLYQISAQHLLSPEFQSFHHGLYTGMLLHPQILFVTLVL